MKRKIITIISAVILGISMVACSSETTESGSTTSGDVTINSQVLTMGMDVKDDTISAIGEPIETLTAPSCQFDGEDTLYKYDGLTLFVYKNGEENTLYIVEIVSDAYQTNEGAKVGMTADEVKEIYGEPSFESDMMLSYETDGVSTDFTLEDGAVSMIEVLQA